jgi:hypothetical protein
MKTGFPWNVLMDLEITSAERPLRDVIETQLATTPASFRSIFPTTPLQTWDSSGSHKEG